MSNHNDVHDRGEKAAADKRRWVHRHTNKIVEVLGRVGHYGIRVRHASGRETTQQEHYFLEDYIPKRETETVTDQVESSLPSSP